MSQQGTSIAPLDPADKRAPQPVKKLCIRCKERKSVILIQTAAFCHVCFQFNFEGKVHHGLEQSRLCTYLHRTEEEKKEQTVGEPSSFQARTPAPFSSYPCKGRVAIGFSGGAASRALLHIAKTRLLRSMTGDSNGASSGKNGKLQEVFAIDVIYIDTSEAIEGAEDQTEKIRAIVQEEGGEEEGIYFWPLKLHDVFDDDSQVECTAEYACE